MNKQKKSMQGWEWMYLWEYNTSLSALVVGLMLKIFSKILGEEENMVKKALIVNSSNEWLPWIMYRNVLEDYEVTCKMGGNV